jgi:hypothetical protein
MKLVRDLERRLESLVESAGSVFGGAIHPVELAARIAREADLSVESGPAGPTTPNVFVLRLNPADLGHLPESRLTKELTLALEQTAVQRGWRLEGPPHVSVLGDPGLSEGTVRCEASVAPGLLRAWARLASDVSPLLVRHNRSIIGRAHASDVVVARPEVSRQHALLWREAGSAWVQDLGSTNGTYIDGRRVDGPAPLTPGCTVTFAAATFTFEPL